MSLGSEHRDEAGQLDAHGQTDEAEKEGDIAKGGGEEGNETVQSDAEGQAKQKGQ